MVTVAVAHFDPSPAKGALILLAVVVFVVACAVRDVRRYPWVPRRGCGGLGVRRSPWNPNAVGPACRKRSHRDGNHMRRRRGAGPQ